MNLDSLNTLTSPAYVADMARIRKNMQVAARIKREAGCTLLLATKAFAMPAVFPLMRDYLDGTTASGPFEARLGAEHFGEQVHCYSPAFSEADVRECLPYSKHVYFNSVGQLKQFAPMVREAGGQVGLRVNPGLSLVKNSALYDPSTQDSRFGVQPAELSAEVMALVDVLHVHNLCENMAADSVRLIQHVSKLLAEPLGQVRAVNFGGGHYVTHPDYDVAALITAIKDFKAKHQLEVILEPGGTWVYDAGYLVGEVMDIFTNSKQHAVLNISASAHMPDVLEVPYRPNLIGGGEAGASAHSYILSGNTCMTGDVIGEYSFAQPLEIGQKLIFTDMMQYSFVKNTTFNGVPLPALALLHEDGRLELVREFGYGDILNRL